MTLSEFDKFVKTLRSHDWFFDRSDDYGVWQRGKEVEQMIVGYAKSDPVLNDLYKSYRNEVYAPSRNESYIEELIKQKRKEFEECDD